MRGKGRSAGTARQRSMGSRLLRARPDEGAAAVEFAIIMVPLLVLLFGILGYGYMLSFRQSVTQAAAEGARAAAVAPASADRDAVAFDSIEATLEGTCTDDADYLRCSTSVPESCDACLSVTVVYDYLADPSKPVFPGLGLVMPDDLRHTATVQVGP